MVLGPIPRPVATEPVGGDPEATGLALGNVSSAEKDLFLVTSKRVRGEHESDGLRGLPFRSGSARAGATSMGVPRSCGRLSR